jgi:hypothetical protein
MVFRGSFRGVPLDDADVLVNFNAKVKQVGTHWQSRSRTQAEATGAQIVGALAVAERSNWRFLAVFEERIFRARQNLPAHVLAAAALCDLGCKM